MEEELKPAEQIQQEQMQHEPPPQQAEPHPPSSPSADPMEDNVGAPSPDQSIEERVPSERIEEEEEVDDLQNQIQRLNEKTEELHADEEFLKEELKVREQETLHAFSRLVEKKRELVRLVQESVNRTTAPLDISLADELEELQRIVSGQESKILHLRTEISKKGLAGVENDESSIRIKNKAEEMEKEIKVGRKFSSTQYVRDYLERPQAYKVSYEEAKYEYELRVRIKESLEQEKQLYERKKEEINQAKKKERELEQELHKELDSLKR